MGTIRNVSIATNEEGFLADPADWSETLALQLANKENINLGDAHMEILLLAREFYGEYGFSPSMRPLSKFISLKTDLSKGRSIYLMQLFPGSPAKLISKIAGLPKPKNCL